MAGSTLGIDGLVSGLDTTSLITSLIQAEASPQTLLKNKQAANSSLVSALQGLNARVASLAEAATKAATGGSWSAVSASSSSTTVTAAGGASAQPGEVSFTVDQVATTQLSVSAPTALEAAVVTGTPPVLTVTRGDGTSVTVQPASGTLSDVAAAISSSDAGVRATVVRAGAAADGTALYRLQVVGTETGAEAGGFSVHAGTAADVAAGTATRLDAQVVRSAQDATITLSTGDTITQSSNVFAALMSGVDVTVSQPTGDEVVTVRAERDVEALTSLASGLVGALGVALSEISTRSATTTTTDPSGRTVVSGGLFSGDSAVRGLQQQLLSAASYPVEGRSPSTVGIELGRDGSFTFDETAFAAALAEDPAAVQRIVAGLAQRVADVAESTSDKYTGSLTLKIQGRETLGRDLGEQISAWDLRLAQRRETLERTYSQLEVTLSSLNSQSSWLAGQLASLSAS